MVRVSNGSKGGTSSYGLFIALSLSFASRFPPFRKKERDLRLLEPRLFFFLSSLDRLIVR
jgi:hypothetical protein